MGGSKIKTMYEEKVSGTRFWFWDGFVVEWTRKKEGGEEVKYVLGVWYGYVDEVSKYDTPG